MAEAQASDLQPCNSQQPNGEYHDRNQHFQ
jgi:hypothetical protein